MTIQTYFLKKGIKNNILYIIKDKLSRENEVLMAVSYFTHSDIADLIINRIKNNKKTKILLNNQDLFRPQNNVDTELKVSRAVVNIINQLKLTPNSCCELKTLGLESQYSTMHHKFIVSEGIDVCFGSMNFTSNSLSNNYENFSVVDDVNIVNSFTKEFYELWGLASELYIGIEGIRSFKCPKCKEEGGIDFESYGVFCTYCNTNFKMTEY